MATPKTEAPTVASLFTAKAGAADAALSGLFSSENKARFTRLLKQPELQAPKVKRVKIAVPQAETVVGSADGDVSKALGKKRKLPQGAEAHQSVHSEDDEAAKPAKIKKPKWKKRAAEEAKAADQSDATATAGADTATAAEDGAEGNDVGARTLFVGNVSLSTPLKTLRTLFAQFGEIASARMRSVPTEGLAVDQAGNQALVRKVSANKQLFSDQKGSYNAYVVFKNIEAVSNALSMNNHVLDGRHIRVDRSTPNQFPPKLTVFLGQLPHVIDEEQLREHFAAVLPNGQDDIESVRLIRDRETLEGKGIGYLWLKDQACIVQALTLDGSTFGKRPIRVSTCGKRTKRTTMTTEEKRDQEVTFRVQKHMGAMMTGDSAAVKRIRSKTAKNPNKGGKAGKGKGKPKGKGNSKGQTKPRKAKK